jgi:hypothetical protein
MQELAKMNIYFEINILRFGPPTKSTSINFMIIGDSFSIVIDFVISCALKIFGHTLCNKQVWDVGNLYEARNVTINKGNAKTSLGCI